MSKQSNDAVELVAYAREHGLDLPGRVLFGNGSVREVGGLAAALADGRRALLVSSRGPADPSPRRHAVAEALERAGLEVTDFSGITGEPTVQIVDEGAACARKLGPDIVVAVGGGSVMDAAKAIAALARNEGSVEDYLEGVGRGLTLEEPPAPMIAVPTTSGTGAEMTKNAVVADPARGFKKSMRDVRMIPSVALIDPELTVSAPRRVTASAGMDAVAQLIEPCITAKRRPETTHIALAALRHAREALPRCCAAPNDLEARGAMALASAMSGICLANAGLALVHGIASGLGGLHPIPHGEICGILLPHALRYNHDACERELAEALAAFLGEESLDAETIYRGIAAIEAMNAEIGVPPDLTHLGFTDEQVHEVAAASLGSSMKGNPIAMTEESTYGFLRPLC